MTKRCDQLTDKVVCIYMVLHIYTYLYSEKEPHTSFTATRMDGVERCMSQLQSRFTHNIPSAPFSQSPPPHVTQTHPPARMQVFQREPCILRREVYSEKTSVFQRDKCILKRQVYSEKRSVFQRDKCILKREVYSEKSP